MKKSKKLLLDPSRAIGNWYNRKMTQSPPDGHRRFKIENVEDETVLAIYLKIGSKSYWMPKSRVNVGLHPSGYYYCADIPEFLSKKNQLS